MKGAFDDLEDPYLPSVAPTQLQPGGALSSPQSAPADTGPSAFGDIGEAPYTPPVGPQREDSILPAAPYGATEALAHGATFGLSGPVSALGTATHRWMAGQGFDYAQAKREEDRGREAYAGAHPWANALFNVVGGFASAPRAAVELTAQGARYVPSLLEAGAQLPQRATQATTYLGNIAKGVLWGGGAGAVQGASDAPPTFGDMAQGALSGAETGAVIGAAIPTLVRSAPAAWNLAKRVWDPAGQAEDIARQKALGVIQQNVRAGYPGLPAMAERLENAPPGSPVSLLDVTGKPGERLAGTLYRSDTPASQIIGGALEGREAGSRGRLISAVDQHISSTPNAVEATAALQAQKEADARPLYDIAMKPGRPIYSDNLQQFLDDPDLQSGLKAGFVSERRQALGVRPFNPYDYAIKFNEAGDPVFFGTPNMRTLDMAKRGLDAQIEAQRDITGKLSTAGGDLVGVRTRYLKELDSLNPDYAPARAAWSGPSHSQDLIKQGQGFLSESPDELGAAMQKMSPTDREFFKIGAADTLRQDIQGKSYGGNPALGVTANPLAEQRIRQLFDNDRDYNNFMQVVENERSIFKTGTAVMRGSPTGERIAADKGGLPSGADLLWPTATAYAIGGLPKAAGVAALGALRPIGQALMQRATGQTPEAQVATAHLFTAMNPAQRQMMINQLLATRQPPPSGAYIGPTTGLLSGVRAAAPELLTGLLAPQ